ncbi:MAG: 3'-5' exonuclease domain-containing protein 2 [Flammeovirgaceae bacterium]|nr:3'-5' exonuclease domain-containing protein 2 [Flammeovirgaceae bacterium]
MIVRKKPDDQQVKTDITKEEINSLPLGSFNGEIILVNDNEAIPMISDELHEHHLVGFDTETRPSFRKGERHSVSLLQLALPHKVFIIQLKQAGLTTHLTQIFENKKITKVGVGLRDDLKALNQLKPFRPNNFIDLSTLAREKNLQVESVKKLTGLFLGFRISKSVQTSNWEAKNLSDRQLSYAATDAWVCLEIYNRLIQIDAANQNA